MTPIAQLDSDFAFVGADEPAQALTAQAVDVLGPLAELPGPGNTPGTWVGHGFNAIWRPRRLRTGQHRCRADLTDEKLVFTRIPGRIPNRGLARPDINMFGLTDMQPINETGLPAYPRPPTASSRVEAGSRTPPSWPPAIILRAGTRA